MTNAQPDILPPSNLVRLGAAPADKEAAIREAAQLLIAAGCIDPQYADSMMRREDVAETYLGHGVAIPHGKVEDRGMVRRNGLSILQVPEGVEWNAGQTVHLVVAIAAESDAHIDTLRRLTNLLQDEEHLKKLFTTNDTSDIINALSEANAEPEANGAPAEDLDERFEWTVDYPSGLHARPASAWVAAARKASGSVQVRKGAAVADAKALVSLLRLGLRQGDTIVISADGPDAGSAIDRMQATVTGLSAQEKADAQAAKGPEPTVKGWTPPEEMPVIAGIGASPGLSIGPIHVYAPADIAIADTPTPLNEGGNRLHEALTVTQTQLRVLADDTLRRLGEAEANIFRAQAELLHDTDLITLACQLMVEGHGLAWSWNEAIERTARDLESNDNEVLAARAADLRDVGRRVLARIDPSLENRDGDPLPAEPCILLAGDLSPSDTAGLDVERVLGLATVQGGPTSHTAILARTLGLPAMVGGSEALLDLEDGTEVILDGQAGRLYPKPSASAIASARDWLAAQEEQHKREIAERSLPARTTDGHQVEIAANINRPDQIELALSQGGEGVGLMRTEFLFLERSSAPTEDEQYETYRAMLDGLEDRPLIVRALDIGGDKQVPHLNLPREANPFLGVRGSRLLLRRLDLLATQLRALYRAARDGESSGLSIMFPMITSVGEMQRLRAVADSIRDELDAPKVPLGAMVEVPAAAIGADILARYVDFFSIGTNDLTQYGLAIDRQHPELAAEADALHPCVLRLIRMTVEGAAKHGRWVGVCGGIAGEPFAASLLTGLGVNELSMTPRDIPAVKAALRETSLSALKALADKALACETAAEVHALDREEL
ncbi:phosphoenolpyruvate--protein phosphotransferase [Afifella aestuarii]|uniref:phosphoenolpyruvate--protein phosphotransferase n=1 Tax=Afifella aestuarii TaxID=1909496 RepID=UPI000FE2DE02|nr:phosphoenolpyruvate--protein phosphotransferase [Afifella aestuarii]